MPKPAEMPEGSQWTRGHSASDGFVGRAASLPCFQRERPCRRDARADVPDANGKQQKIVAAAAPAVVTAPA
jgi:hypothetical protein